MNVDFVNVKTVTIPEGECKEIRVDGQVVWQYVDPTPTESIIGEWIFISPRTPTAAIKAMMENNADTRYEFTFNSRYHKSGQYLTKNNKFMSFRLVDGWGAIYSIDSTSEREMYNEYDRSWNDINKRIQITDTSKLSPERYNKLLNFLKTYAQRV